MWHLDIILILAVTIVGVIPAMTKVSLNVLEILLRAFDSLVTGDLMFPFVEIMFWEIVDLLDVENRICFEHFVRCLNLVTILVSNGLGCLRVIDDSGTFLTFSY